jgi:hypothetical protein
MRDREQSSVALRIRGEGSEVCINAPPTFGNIFRIAF